MNFRKSLIQLANRIESAWTRVDLSSSPLILHAGWYVTEFVVQGLVQHTPRIIISTKEGKQIERLLTGFHTGRNRMLVYLPTGRMLAFSKSIEFKILARVPWWEGRARVLLICSRYLVDFFSIRVLIRMLLMQFKKPFDLSSDLLLFYTPESMGYLRNIRYWDHFKTYRRSLTWFYRRIKVAVVIEDESQREALHELLVIPDEILLASQQHCLRSDIDFVIPLARTEQLKFLAILMIKRAIKSFKSKKAFEPSLVYTDHDYDYAENTDGHSLLPAFKPGPGLAYLYCFNYLGPSVIFAKDSLQDIALTDLLLPEKQYRLTLQLFSDVSRVLHIDEALFTSHRKQLLQTPKPDSANTKWPDISWQRCSDYNVLQADISWQDTPSVDLIIPTRDGLHVLEPCIESILRLTDYANYTIIIVDNGSELAETHEFLNTIVKNQRVKVVDFPGEFNYSAINNFAISQGSSEYVAMINNDIEVIHADWLSQMMVWVKQPNVGIVGAKLLFGDGRIQHAGVVIGMGNAAGHIHRLENGESLGYQNRCVATQNMMAVTAACLITPRELFDNLGGLDAQFLKVAYNDIDYCLRVEQLGLDVIWTPQARLYHHESVSRGDDMSDKHIERYFYELGILQKRWKTKGFVDKYYSKHLRISDEGVYPQITVKGADVLHYLEKPQHNPSTR